MKMKSLKAQFIGAIAMVLVAAIAMGSSTYAWFAMNSQVTATGMNIQAKSEGGIVIANESKADWNNSATASHTASLAVVPTSTADTTNWYHSSSLEFDDANVNHTANLLTLATDIGTGTNNTGAGFVDGGDTPNGAYDSATETAYYLLNKFYIKSSADAMNATLYINTVSVSGVSTSTNLDKALRVAVKVGSQVFIYAPVNGADTAYKVNASAENITCINAYNTNVNTATAITTIPVNTTETPIEASVYVYFEGEDENCKSSNITATLDGLQISVVFGTSALA